MQLKNLGKKFRALSALCYDCTCDVYEYRYLKNPASAVWEKSLVKAFGGVPCRLSYEKFGSSSEKEDVNGLSVGIKLFWDGNDAEIKEGSLLHVFKDGKEFVFHSAGGCAFYGSHCEVRLVSAKDKA